MDGMTAVTGLASAFVKKETTAAMSTPRDLLPNIPIGHPDSMMSEESVRRAVEKFRTRPSDIIVATFVRSITSNPAVSRF